MFIGWFEKFGYKKADHVVSLLPNAKSHIEEVAKAGHKFVCIPNGLDESVLVNEALEADYMSKIPKDKFIVGYTGTIGLANALEYFVDAAELLKDDQRFAFVIIGEGYLKKDLQEKSKNFGNIYFLDKIRKNQVQSAITYFDVCFVGRNNTPLYEHGVSANKYFDYMLAEKPILDSSNKIKDPVELSGCGIIVQPDSAQSIVDGLIQLFEMGSENRLALGKKGKKYLLENHSIKHLAYQYIELFK